MINARIQLGEETKELQIPTEGNLPDAIMELKAQAGQFMTDYLAARNLSQAEVNTMEETIGGEEKDPTTVNTNTNNNNNNNNNNRKRKKRITPTTT